MKKLLKKEGRSKPSQINLKEKLSLIILFLAVLNIQAKNDNTQKTKITLNYESTSVLEIINEIEIQTDFLFIYKVKNVDLDRKINIEVDNEEVPYVLDYIFHKSNIDYVIVEENREIHLTRPHNDTLQNSQTLEIKGTVKDDKGMPLPGASIIELNTSNGTTTDFDGKYSILVSSTNAILEFSYMGFKTKQVNIDDTQILDVYLEVSENVLGEVVVTALGIKQEKKALGYASQELKSDEVSSARETNLLNSISGKVAGMQITNGSSSIGGSARVSIRGEASLNLNGNSPLFVVDGTPISNEMVGSSGSGAQDVDYGNGVAEINPENIASINVLKGPAAAALYGSRAANGVVIITTKKGDSKKEGIGVTFSSSLSAENILTLPDWQNEYGQGNNQTFSFVDGKGGGVSDGVDESWGPKLDTGL